MCIFLLKTVIRNVFPEIVHVAVSKQQYTSYHLIIMATVRVMSPADTPTADAKAMTLRRPGSGRIKEKVISMAGNKKKGTRDER